ncbi:hypothetical protein BDF20DRAFT_834940 [Mycotypha africana]|uniref:uncharacterized protein n=1 Tax=Mycotypha africana TaxID=64632 RepID=UPI0023004555|nr:uncharacterized protein BDF20DRAFT_834940 [Mycotypha africana]KAI8982305.1 hypothetical protein BDF20DRAFT_834940 [Mycotypha africana]
MDMTDYTTPQDQQLPPPPPVPVHNFYHPPDFYHGFGKGKADPRQIFHNNLDTEYECTAAIASSSSDDSSDEGDMTDYQQQLQIEKEHTEKLTKEHSFWQVHSSTTIIAPPCAFEEANIVIDIPPLKPRQKNQPTKTSVSSTTTVAPLIKALTPLPRLQPGVSTSATIAPKNSSVSKQQQLLCLATHVRDILGSVIDEVDKEIDTEWDTSRESSQKSLNQPPPSIISLRM